MMEGWKEVRLADYYDISSGLSKAAGEFGSGYPFVSFKNVFWNYFLPDTLSELVNTTEKERITCSVKYGDVFLTRTSEKIEELGMSSVALKDYPNATFNGFTKRLRPKRNDEIDPLFIGFYLRSQQFRAEITAYSTLTTRASLNNGIIGRLRINLPPLPIQRKIAAILSAYDDLIENNLKRIKLLEEKAQLTYEEWFVRMKFPGHENTPVDKETGLPEGWEKKTFSSVVDVNPKTTIKKGVVAPYVPMSSISEFSMTIQPIEKRAVSGGTKFKNGDTLFVRITPCLENGKTGFVQFLENNDDIATGSTEYIVLRETVNCGRFFIYCTSREEEFRENAVKSMAGSDGRQRVKTDCFDKYFINHGTEIIRTKFEKFAYPIFRSIQVLVNQNQNLKEARDILLPRLMTGMIDPDKISGQVVDGLIKEPIIESTLNVAAEPEVAYGKQ